MEENLHLTVNRLTVVMHHRMQKITEAIFVVAQFFKKLLLLFDERFCSNHRFIPLPQSIIPMDKDREMLVFLNYMGGTFEAGKSKNRQNVQV